MFSKIRSATKVLFNRYLLLTNTITCGGLFAFGDAIVQNIEHLDEKRVSRKSGASSENAGSISSGTWTYDWPRTRRMFYMGVILGPINHGWYSFLDQKVIGSGLKVVVKKIAADQAVAAPFSAVSFFIGLGLMEGNTIGCCLQEVKDKFMTVYMADCFIWPPVQLINFYFLPTQLRVVYVSGVTLCWNAFLSWMKQKDYTTGEHHLTDAVQTTVR